MYFEQKDQLYISEDLHTSRAICTPKMSRIQSVVSLPQHLLAVYGERGISIVNSTLEPEQKNLRIQDYFYDPASTDETNLFTLANPDVSVEMVDATLSEGETLSGDNDLDIITQAYSSDIPRYYQKSYIASLSKSFKLYEVVQSYYPQVREALSSHGSIYAIPYNIIFNYYQVNNNDYTAAGLPDFPKDLISLFQQVERYATNDPYDGAQTHMENILYDLTQQYYAQNAKDSVPFSFDTPLYRYILARCREIAANGTTGSFLYFHRTDLNVPESLSNALQSDGLTPLAFPLEANQPPKLMADFSVYVIDDSATNMEEAIRYLEFVSTQINSDLNCMLKPQASQKSFDAFAKRQQMIECSLAHLQNESVDQADEALHIRIDALQNESVRLKQQKSEATNATLLYYLSNADNTSFQWIGCYDFVNDYEKTPYFCSFLSGSMSADDLILMLNARAYENYAVKH